MQTTPCSIFPFLNIGYLPTDSLPSNEETVKSNQKRQESFTKNRRKRKNRK